MELDTLGQLPSLDIYTQLSLIFPTPNNNNNVEGNDNSERLRIETILKNGLERLSQAFPWLAGHVVVVENDDLKENKKAACFQISSRPGKDTSCLVIKDLCTNNEGTEKSHKNKNHEILTMEKLRDQDFPFSLLDETVVAPQNTLPEPRDTMDGRSISTRDVFLVQATFIPGGLILTLVGHHGSMDMVGQGQVIRWFSQACRNEPFSEEDIRIGNMSRPNLIPRFTSDQEEQEADRLETILSNQINDPSTCPSSSPPAPPKEIYWAYILFPQASLESIKGRAMDDLLNHQQDDNEKQFVSTDDALTAFLWRSITRCRQQRLGDNFQTTLGRAVDVRRYFDNHIPETYPGMMQNMTYHIRHSAKDLLSSNESLGHTARELRKAVDPNTSNLNYNTRALATYMDRLEDKSVISYAARINPSSDLMISSWTKVDCFDSKGNPMDFGLGLGSPEVVRRPRFTPVEGLVYFMPRKPNSEDGIVVGMCLRSEDWKALLKDDHFKSMAKYIG